MRLPGVRTSTGARVTLLFVESGVHVLETAGWRRRLFRIAGAAVFAAVALAVIGVGVEHALNPLVGTVLAVAAPALAVAAGVAAATAWVLNLRAERARHHNGAGPDITVERVAWARSSRHDGRVHVVVGMTDGSSHEFIASGATGTRLGHYFGQLLSAERPESVTAPTSDSTDPP